MEIFYTIIIFMVVLFIYVHVFFHISTSDDLEVYEIKMPSKDKLEELCDLKQPVKLSYTNTVLNTHFVKKELIQNYGAFDVSVRNAAYTDSATNTTENDSLKHIILTLQTTIELLQKDDESSYFTERNQSFIEETTLIKQFKMADSFLRPYMVSSCHYDVMFGSKNTTTPLRREVSYRNYYYVTEGSVTIKFAPNKYTKYLYSETDNELFEFRARTNPWKPQESYKNDFNKVQFMEVTINKNEMVFIPAYWWYSIRFNSVDSTVVSFKYFTYMNTVSVSPKLILHYLQRLNTKSLVEKTAQSIPNSTQYSTQDITQDTTQNNNQDTRIEGNELSNSS